jgi:CheY-like chemotaxis protein
MDNTHIDATPQAFAHQALPTARRPPLVLVVDDDLLMRDLLSRTLVDANLEVLTAACGEEAVRICQARSGIDVLLTDLQMPGMDGLQVLAAIRREAPWVRCCLMTGSGQDFSAEQLAGASFITKPFSIDRVARLVWRLLENR